MFGKTINKEDILGQTFERWTVLSLVNNHSTGRMYYNCLCSCGQIGIVKRAALLNMTSKSCGCLRRQNKIVNLCGQTFGRLTILTTTPGNRKSRKRSSSRCLCQCGSILEIETSNLTTQNTTSCGCFQKEVAAIGSTKYWTQKLIEEFGSLEEYKLQKKIKTRLRSRIWHAVKNGTKVGSAVKDLGCSVLELKKHLESQFKSDMNWGNYGLGPGKWQIDHIKRLNDFDLSNRDQFLKACHYTNLQPLLFEEHLVKTIKENQQCHLHSPK